jgi:hypothetical protein
LKIAKRDAAYSLVLGLLLLALFSIQAGGGNLEYDVVTCPIPEEETYAPLCYQLRGHGSPLVWLEVEYTMNRSKTGHLEAVNGAFERILWPNFTADLILFTVSSFIGLEVLVSSKKRSTQDKGAVDMRGTTARFLRPDLSRHAQFRSKHRRFEQAVSRRCR